MLSWFLPIIGYMEYNQKVNFLQVDAIVRHVGQS